MKRWSRSSVCWRCIATADSAFLQAPRSEVSSLEPSEAPPVVFGDFVLECEIAHGGMGVVYRALQVSLGRTVAVKLLLLGRHASAESVTRFRREAQAAAALRHPNIVTIHEVGQWEGQHYFSMEFVDGPNLAELLRRGPMSAERAADIARTLSRAIQYAHERGVLHRDLKPSNVLVDPQGQVLVTDFGLAKRLDGSSDLTVTGQMVGTPNYLSPEAAAGRQDEVGPLSDVYAIGAVLYELLTGRPPFLAQSLQETLIQIRDSDPPAPHLLVPAVPRDVETICLKALEKDPAARYGSARDLAEDLDRWLRREPILARPTNAVARLGKWARRQPRLAGMLLATTLAGVATFVTLTVAYVRVSAAQQAAQAKAEESRQRLVRLNVLSGSHLSESGDPHGGLLWFVEAMQLEGGEPAREEIHRRRLAASLHHSPRLVGMAFHEGFVEHLELSGDGGRILSASDDGTVRLWEGATGRPLVAPMRHPAALFAAAFTADPHRILTTCWDARIRLWDVGDSGRLVRERELDPGYNGLPTSPDGRWCAVRLSGGAQLLNAVTLDAEGPVLPGSAGVRDLRFSSDNRRVLGIGTNHWIRIWDLPSGRPWGPGVQATGLVRLIAYDPEGDRLAATLGESDQKVILWSGATGARLLDPFRPGGDLFDLRFSHDRRWLATASWDGEARVFDARTGVAVSDAMHHRRGVSALAFSPDDRALATASWDGTARVWDVRSGHPVSPHLHQAGYVMWTRFGPDGRRLVTAGQDQTVRIWDLGPAHAETARFPHGAALRSARFSPDGARLITAGDDGSARIWDRKSGRLLGTLSDGGMLFDARFSPDGRHVATGGSSARARIWDVERGTEATPALVHESSVRSVEFSPDSTRLLTASNDGTARVWSVASGAPLTEPMRHGGPVNHAAFSPDGRFVVTGSSDRTARLWDSVTGAQVGQALQHDCDVESVAFSPDGESVLTAASDRSQLARSGQIWNRADGQRRTPPLRHTDGVLFAAFSPDGRRVVTCSEDTTALVWNAATGVALTPPLRHGSYVVHAAFSPDSQLLLTTSSDGTARVWDAGDGEPVTPPLVHDGPVTFGAWSPDGNEVLTAPWDGTARLWDLRPTRIPIAELRRQAELLSAHRLESDLGMVPLTPDELRARWQPAPIDPVTR